MGHLYAQFNNNQVSFKRFISSIKFAPKFVRSIKSVNYFIVDVGFKEQISKITVWNTTFRLPNENNKQQHAICVC